VSERIEIVKENHHINPASKRLSDIVAAGFSLRT
jgi:hypothetical protein